ncbi:MAG: hypothetical protein BWY62_00744 [Firmicutes bacterium ADurb.Bin356]|mgnify:FL=1|nr:MAG: hypothetical protein BWY62_00744 [Firmicutes bacterium ADurb.Bin356]
MLQFAKAVSVFGIITVLLTAGLLVVKVILI